MSYKTKFETMVEDGEMIDRDKAQSKYYREGGEQGVERRRGRRSEEIEREMRLEGVGFFHVVASLICTACNLSTRHAKI